MSLNKKKMVREIGHRTRLSNRDVQRVIETLVDVWMEELVSGGRIELENFLVLEVKAMNSRRHQIAQRRSCRVIVRTSRRLRLILSE